MWIIYVIFQDPGISNTQKAGSYYPYDLGMKLGVFVNDSNNKPLVGVVSSDLIGFK